MKRVDIERHAIERALKEQPNITEAAHVLGASRRTLQSRMRDYDIPPGKAGRPRNLLPYTKTSTSTVGLVVVGCIVGAGGYLFYRWAKNEQAKLDRGTVVGEDGFDLLGV